jgi:hypothetical protein
MFILPLLFSQKPRTMERKWDTFKKVKTGIEYASFRCCSGIQCKELW